MMDHAIGVIHLGSRPYAEMVEHQRRLANCRRDSHIGDLVLVLEHPATYTKGRRTEPGDLPWNAEWYAQQGIQVCDTPRGGKVTYHGPGQLVAYPIFDLRGLAGGRVDVPGFVATLEAAMIAALARWDVAAGTVEGQPGVWVGSEGALEPGAPAERTVPLIAEGRIRKIGSIGLHISRGVSTHGIAINVSGDLTPFSWISPCGFERCEMSSIELEAGASPEVDEVGDAFAEELAARLGRPTRTVDPEHVGLAIASLGR